MVKQIIILLVLSCLIILGVEYIQYGLHGLLVVHQYVLAGLHTIFAQGNRIAEFLTGLLGLLIVPGIIGGIVGGIYWSIKKRSCPYTMPIVWAIWLVLVTTIILQYKLIVPH